MSAVIQLRNVTKSYTPGKGPPALDSVSLDIQPGALTLLMGPSGSGKTTLISIMGAILRPSSGDVRIAGSLVSGMAEKRLPAVRLRHIGFIFQSFNLMPTLTAAENVELVLELKGLRGAKARKMARQLLDEVGLSEKCGELPADLSGGQKQRIAIARALAGDPDVILADEPTAALDGASGRLIMDKLRDLASKGRAILIVTHDTRILPYADRIIQIEDGRIMSDDRSRILSQLSHHATEHQAREQRSNVEEKSTIRGFSQLLLMFLLVLVTAWVSWWLTRIYESKKQTVPSAPAVKAEPTRVEAASGGPPPLVAAAGRVEPISEELKISSPNPGRLLDVPVKEGQHLAAGQIIAILDSGELSARIAQAEANVRLRQAELERIQNGSTIYERQAAEAAIAEAKASVENARREMLQRQALVESGDLSRADFQHYQSDFQAAQLRLDKASIAGAAVQSSAREDELARAEASLHAAEAQLAEAQALAEKTRIRAPFAGVVLKRYRRGGEEVGTGADPIISFGDISQLVVRVDVDENDIANVRVGDRAYVVAQAYGKKRFLGRVTQIGSQLGRKNIETGDPMEKVDTRVLETLVSLDGHPELPIGLRVDAFIEKGK